MKRLHKTIQKKKEIKTYRNIYQITMPIFFPRFSNGPNFDGKKINNSEQFYANKMGVECGENLAYKRKYSDNLHRILFKPAMPAPESRKNRHAQRNNGTT